MVLQFDRFERRDVITDHGAVHVRVGGRGRPVLLLHGFPETGLMWREVAPALARRFTVIVADLPGYGESECPDDIAGGHDAMSKRAMARTLVQAMERLGHPNFSVVGHDRGGRAAYRMALDHPDRVEALAVLDVIPTSDVWALANDRMALAFWPFSFLAQPAPFPETLAGAAPEAVIENVIQTWGSTPAAFPPWVRAAYVEALKDPRRVHAICEEYRAAAGVDRRDDLADQAAGRRIECPVLALWSGAGALNDWYADQGGPLGVWRRWAPGVTGEPVSGGHFFPEEHPVLTADALDRFLSSSVPAGEGR